MLKIIYYITNIDNNIYLMTNVDNENIHYFHCVLCLRE